MNSNFRVINRPTQQFRSGLTEFSKLFMIGVITFLSIANMDIHAQSIITADSWQTTSLTAQQALRYGKILNQATASEVTKITIGDIATISNNRIDLDILNSDCDNTIFKGKNVEYRSSTDYIWYGELEFNAEDTCACKEGHLLLISKDGETFGQLKMEEEFYTIEDIGGKNIIVREPTDGAHITSCGGALAPVEEDEPEQETEVRSAGNCDVKILILYTPAADDRINNIHNLARTSVTITNQALKNSGISSSDLTFKIAAIEEIDINEQGQKFDDVINSLPNPSSLAAIRRKAVKADIVILFVDHFIMDDDQPAGVAFLGPNNYSAYGVVKSIGVNNGYTFTHEVGHLLGARHEPCNAHDVGAKCDDNGDHEHAHTWSYETRCLFKKKTHNRKTIMYSGGGSNSDLVQHFSNPNVKIDNRNTGIVDERDNALQLITNACTVANFETEDDYLSLRIGGQTKICFNENACLSTLILGSPGPYTYQWKLNANGVNWNSTSVAGTGSSYCFSTPLSTFGVGDMVYFQLKVTAANNDVSYAYHSLEIVDDGYNGMPCMQQKRSIESNKVFQITPNPANDWLNVKFSLEKGSKVWIDIYNTSGAKIQSLNRGLFQHGEFLENIDISNLHIGTHFIHLRTEDSIQVLPFIKL